MQKAGNHPLMRSYLDVKKNIVPMDSTHLEEVLYNDKEMVFKMETAKGEY